MRDNRQKKSFGIFSIFRSSKTRRRKDVSVTDDFVKSYNAKMWVERMILWNLTKCIRMMKTKVDGCIDKRTFAYITVTEKELDSCRCFIPEYFCKFVYIPIFVNCCIHYDVIWVTTRKLYNNNLLQNSGVMFKVLIFVSFMLYLIDVKSHIWTNKLLTFLGTIWFRLYLMFI